MRKPIPTTVHGVLDYMTAGLLFALPRALGWGTCATRVMDIAGSGAVAYSLLTKYELGVVKVLPMKAHLALDAMSGAALIGAAALMDEEDADVRATIAGVGAFEIAASLMSNRPRATARAAKALRRASRCSRTPASGGNRRSSRACPFRLRVPKAPVTGATTAQRTRTSHAPRRCNDFVVSSGKAFIARAPPRYQECAT